MQRLTHSHDAARGLYLSDADPTGAQLSHAAQLHTAFGRLGEAESQTDAPCRVHFLGVCVWHAAYPFLTKVSQESAPTGCQLRAAVLPPFWKLRGKGIATTIISNRCTESYEGKRPPR